MGDFWNVVPLVLLKTQNFQKILKSLSQPHTNVANSIANFFDQKVHLPILIFHCNTWQVYLCVVYSINTHNHIMTSKITE